MLAENAKDEPAFLRYRRMADAWQALADKQDWPIGIKSTVRQDNAALGHTAGTLAFLPLWVPRDSLALRQALPVLPEQRTFADRPAMSQRCQEQTIENCFFKFFPLRLMCRTYA